MALPSVALLVAPWEYVMVEMSGALMVAAWVA